MQFKRFVSYTTVTLTLSLATACGDDSGSNGDTSANSTDSGIGTEDSAGDESQADGGDGGPATSSDGGGNAGSSGESTGPVAESSSSGGGTACTEDDACRTADDCLPGQGCVECFCVGDPVGCNEWGPGEFGACLEEGEDCGVADGKNIEFGCVVDNSANAAQGVCYFGGCTDTCDCPEPPAGFEAQVTCGPLVDPDGNCFISCEGGLACPDGMGCVADYFCAPIFSGAEDFDPYDDCVNDPGFCPETPSGAAGVCLQVPGAGDESTVEGGFCTTDGCESADDCAQPSSGDAVPTCTPLTGTETPNCHLSCANGETCPDGMICHPDFGLCYSELQFLEPYGECSAADGACPGDGENCLVNTDNTISVCTNSCTTDDDCPREPTGTGDAPVICTDAVTTVLGCSLDCSAGQTCPDGMICVENLFCANEVPA